MTSGEQLRQVGLRIGGCLALASHLPLDTNASGTLELEMSALAPRYDVALSFLYPDLNLAKALYDELTKGLEVFFFPRSQEELAGTEGLESMREPFRNESRLNVVLYRPRWGKTPWTAVEETAIKESCLDTGFKSLFFLVIEPTTDLPKWLPETHVRFNYADFGIEQAVGAIKARVQERGGQVQPLTPARKAELLQAEEEFQNQKAYLLSSETAIFQEVETLFQEIVRQCEEVNAGGHFEILESVALKRREIEQICTIGQDQVSLSVIWYQPFAGTLHKAVLVVREFDRQLILPPGHFFLSQPRVLKETKYLPDVSRTRAYGWRRERGPGSYIAGKDLATDLVLQFLDFLERDRTGKIRRREQ